MNLTRELTKVFLTFCIVLVSITANAAVVRVGPGVYGTPHEGRYYFNNYPVNTYAYPTATYGNEYYNDNEYNYNDNYYSDSVGMDSD